MSLTNPNKVVTEERLSEFYTGILPYLGGMPEMVANKFSKGDLYSTDEKMIGQWTDSKPLYQKTYHFTGLAKTASFSYAHGISNVDNWVGIKALTKRNANTPISYQLPMMYLNESGGWYSNNSFGYVCVTATNIAIRRGSDVYDDDIVDVTLQYTKTTDSAIAIGSDTDYSTTEKIVGTWIDGKPLYQKTIVQNSTAGTMEYTVNLNITNLDYVIKGDGFSIRTSDKLCKPIPFLNVYNGSAQTTNVASWMCYPQEGNGGQLVIRSTNDASWNGTYYITIRYTKA